MNLSVTRHRLGLGVAIIALMLPVLFGMLASAAYASTGSAGIAGRVTEKAAPYRAIGGVSVVAYVADGAGEWNWTGGGSTDASGYYDVAGLGAGTYRVSFQDGSGYFAQQYYNGKSKLGSATNVVLGGDQLVTGIDVALAEASHIAGRVTEKMTGDPIADMNVSVILPDGSTWWSLPAFTDSSGYYDVGGLAAGTYQVVFGDQSGYYARQYYNHKPTLALAGQVTVREARTASGINAALVEAETRPPHTTANAPKKWRTSGAKITLKATDSGSGVFAKYYRINGGATRTYKGAFTVSSTGANTVEYWSIDWAGNVEAAHRATVTILGRPSSHGTPSRPSAPSSVRHGHSFTIFGTVVKHASGSHPVTLQFYRYQSGHWVLRKSTAAKASTVLSYSKYSDSTSVPSAGKWKVRARHKAGSHYRYSTFEYFTAS